MPRKKRLLSTTRWIGRENTPTNGRIILQSLFSLVIVSAITLQSVFYYKIHNSLEFQGVSQHVRFRTTLHHDVPAILRLGRLVRHRSQLPQHNWIWGKRFQLDIFSRSTRGNYCSFIYRDDRWPILFRAKSTSRFAPCWWRPNALCNYPNDWGCPVGWLN